ncbi:uncharacterized protein ASPGLDRAFT_35497 [Aspergillus glaucus CBS 516.65]|uniref:Isochorismatase-like domain-containing protein n=1 Tax=Aspergillus glaucus CBS 516.65 TaxID=1160497 RepID=A0A1L9VJW8_ASPGL|nr:hypothetical protein ASPGLDRAFT_35497 [Aspergillus glaucus CBS 516.65]OJJ84217.1 hypothetical protein ASPGLDRAFT_35497 [Aspergillus glaucus CBS 516.65]
MPVPSRTAIVLIDPYNDFLHLDDAATKVWPLLARVSTVAEWVSILHGNAIGVKI